MPSKLIENKDLKVLQREYRNMEVNRRAFAEESHLVLRKQQQTLEKLRSENETLKNDIGAREMKISFRPVTTFEQSVIDRLYTDIDKYTNQIKNEQGVVHTTLEEISKLKDQVWHQRKSMGGVNAARDNQRQIEKQVRILENRLDQALIKFNKSTASNKKLRQQIDNLRSERKNFESVHNKLEKELHEKKKQMGIVIEQSNIAYENRDKAQLEITAIEQASKKEQELFDEQMNELGIALEKELNFFTQTKKMEFKNKKIEQDDGEKSCANIPPKTHSHEHINENDIQRNQERVQNFEDAFRKISAATGISDVEELVQTFIANEEQNFSLFTYANEQADEIDKLEGQLEDLKKEKTRYTEESGNNESQYKSVLEELNEKLNITNSHIDKLEKACEENQHVMSKLKNYIKDLVRNLECKFDTFDGCNNVTDTNMPNFLAIIEERSNEILSAYHNLKSQGHLTNSVSSNANLNNPLIPTSSSKPSILGVGPSAPMGRDPISVNPPKLADYASDEGSSEDCETRPLTRDEIQSKTLSWNEHQRGNHKVKKPMETKKTKRNKALR